MQTSVSLTLIKEDNRVSEQTFGVMISLDESGPGVRPASLQQNDQQVDDFDYVLGRPGSTSIVRIFEPNATEVRVSISLFPDDTPEGLEGFRMSIASLGRPYGYFQLPVATPGSLPGNSVAYASTEIRIFDNDCKHGFYPHDEEIEI